MVYWSYTKIQEQIRYSRHTKNVIYETLGGFRARCLKITEKVSFNIASEASYVYILSGQMVNFGEFLKPEACGQTVSPDRSVLIGQKLVENAKIQMRHFG